MKISDVLDELPTDEDSGRVFGEPHVTADGTTVIPVVRIRSGRPPVALGVFVIRGEEASWQAVIDHNRAALLGTITGLLAAVIGTLAVLRQPPWPRMTITR